MKGKGCWCLHQVLSSVDQCLTGLVELLQTELFCFL